MVQYEEGNYGLKFDWKLLREEEAGGETETLEYVLLWDEGIPGNPINTVLFRTDQTSYERTDGI